VDVERRGYEMGMYRQQVKRQVSRNRNVLVALLLVLIVIGAAAFGLSKLVSVIAADGGNNKQQATITASSSSNTNESNAIGSTTADEQENNATKESSNTSALQITNSAAKNSELYDLYQGIKNLTSYPGVFNGIENRNGYLDLSYLGDGVTAGDVVINSVQKTGDEVYRANTSIGSFSVDLKNENIVKISDSTSQK